MGVITVSSKFDCSDNNNLTLLAAPWKYTVATTAAVGIEVGGLNLIDAAPTMALGLRGGEEP